MPASAAAASSYRQGARALQSGQLKQAEAALWSCLAEDPSHAGALHLLGRVRQRQGQHASALALQLASWRIAPELGWNAFAAAELLETDGRWGEAAAAYRAAAAALPGAIWIRSLADRCEGLGMFAGARLSEGLSDAAYQIWCRRLASPLVPSGGTTGPVDAGVLRDWIVDRGAQTLLRPGALAWLAAQLNASPDTADLLYCDEDCLGSDSNDADGRDAARAEQTPRGSGDWGQAAGERPAVSMSGQRLALAARGRRHDPWFKPGWVPESFWSTPWLGSLALWRRSWLRQHGLPPPPAPDDGLGRWRWQLQALACGPRIAHLDRILVHRRQPAQAETSDSAWNPRPFLAHAAALAEHLRHCGEGAVTVTPSAPSGRGPGGRRHDNRDPAFRLSWALPARPRISVVVLSRDRPDLLERCLHSVESSRGGLELAWLLVDNGSRLEATASLLRHWRQRPGSQVEVLPFDQPFNWSLLNNRAAATATGDLLLFLNNDVEVPQRTQTGWLEEMAGLALRPAIGCVGARLLYPNGTIQHAGILPAMGAGCEHPYRGMAPERTPHRGRAQQLSGWPAVTGACLMLRRALWWDCGGFDPQFPVEGNDVEFCLRLGSRGLRHVVCPQATLTHHEAASRVATAGSSWRAAQSLLMRRWPAAMAGGAPWWPAACSLDSSDGRPRELAGRGWI